MENDNFIQHCQYCGCWWLGDERSQDISNHGIDVVLLENSDLKTRKVRISQYKELEFCNS